MGINIGLDIGIASVGLAVVDSDTGNVLETVAVSIRKEFRLISRS